jgi:uncharacterized protein
MKIWIDIVNSPHINFFKPFIKEWKSQNAQVIITTRDLANTIDLLKLHNIDYIEIGGHGGRNKIKKLLNFPLRVLQLYYYLRKLKPDIGISQSSFYSPLVCKLLGIPSIYLNDNEFAKGNHLAFKYSTMILLPEYLKEITTKLGWTVKYNIDYYPGIKEGIYLSQTLFRKNGNKEAKSKMTIYIRPEPWTAEYYAGKQYFMDSLIKSISGDYNIIILPRNSQQTKHYKAREFTDISVADKPLDLESIYNNCSLFIGAGGSMTREIAYLGIPTISVYQDKLLEVDKYLIVNKIMHHFRSIEKKDIKIVINQQMKSSNNMLAVKGNDAFRIINKIVMDYAKN